jgi:membrane protein DedA with SNARE-associated domain
MNAAIVGTLARSVLLTLGGYFVAKGYLDNDTLTQIVSAVVTLATAAWGVVEKVKR